MMYFISAWDCSVVIAPYCALNVESCAIMPGSILVIQNSIKKLMIVVDNFNGRRCGQIAFEYVNAMTFKIVVGVFAQDGESCDDFSGKLHTNHSLQKFCGIDRIQEIE